MSPTMSQNWKKLVPHIENGLLQFLSKKYKPIKNQKLDNPANEKKITFKKWNNGKSNFSVIYFGNYLSFGGFILKIRILKI